MDMSGNNLGELLRLLVLTSQSWISEFSGSDPFALILFLILAFITDHNIWSHFRIHGPDSFTGDNRYVAPSSSYL